MEEIIFEDYNIRITEDDLRSVDKESLVKCKERLKETLLKLED